ncbi:DUF6623 family protein [Massilia sp. CCM 8734]|uniref:DUF6623 family protein n=1 Tax=Massilia sp. CCM 8734 TaxID=2609283 RepID=UPI0014237C1E|nr:DUF6623 family protein [Massilia sp. CCM 8734]NHZ95189.1 hypothetical protein [Massilia sp. CCM 8734]
MALQAMWVPGYVAQVEIPGNTRLRLVNGIPWTDVTGLRIGWGTTFRGAAKQTNWFHFAIPTPVITDGKRVTLDRVFVLYNASPGARVEAAHIWDGPNRIRNYDGLNLTGNHGGGIDASNTWAGGGGPVFWGIGVSILVRFTSEANIHFSTAGGDFTS